jgi:cell division protein FtsB
MHLLKGPARIAIVSLFVVAIMFLFVFPTRSFLSQRDQISGARHDLAVLRTQNARLQKEAARLDTDAEIRRIAREEYHLVLPGEKAYEVLPAGPTTSTTTAP